MKKRFIWIFILIATTLNILYAKNAPFSLYELKGDSDGATLLVIGGIHGDEPGGYCAPSILINSYHILKGNVLVVPNLNPDSIMAFKRGI